MPQRFTSFRLVVWGTNTKTEIEWNELSDCRVHECTSVKCLSCDAPRPNSNNRDAHFISQLKYETTSFRLARMDRKQKSLAPQTISVPFPSWCSHLHGLSRTDYVTAYNEKENDSSLILGTVPSVRISAYGYFYVGRVIFRRNLILYGPLYHPVVYM